MRNYYSVPLIFFFLAALLGLFLRWQFVMPTPGIRYTYFLHSHSHVMFLGWVFNVLYLYSIEHYLAHEKGRGYTNLFVFLQILVVAMMISFPIQGYGLWSIIFSTAHTLAVMIFIPIFFLRARDSSISLWFLRIAWAFFFLSTLGPFSLGYLMANDLGGSVWYNFSIYYYLHFQYNGFFFFGILGMFFHFLEENNILFSRSKMKAFGTCMALSCIPAYLLSVLFAGPPIFVNVIAGVAALAQVIAILYLIIELNRTSSLLLQHTSRFVRLSGFLIVIALIIKMLLQLASAHPHIARLAWTMRPVVIAYLHLVLLGVITLFLLTWYTHKRMLHGGVSRIAFAILVIGFGGSQLILTATPWWSKLMPQTPSSATLILVLSSLMVVAAFLYLLAFWKREPRASSPDA